MTKHRPYFKADKGLDKQLVVQLSEQKNEPGWMTDSRLRALEYFHALALPSWGPNLQELVFEDLHYYVRPLEKQQTSWEQVPEHIKRTFQVLGVPQAEQQFLAGVGAQYESEVIYKSLQERWQHAGVVFLDMHTALTQYEQIVKKYFATVVPANDNKFAALNTAIWSGGSFVYIPKGVQVVLPLQAYFRMDTPRMGQFERTLIIAEEGSSFHYIEGCSAPVYRSASLHSAVVEIIAQKSSQVRYTTIQNWSTNVYNLVTKRAVAYQDATVEWLDGNFGSAVTMKYPTIILKESGAKGQLISIAIAKKGQYQDSGGSMVHEAANTTSYLLSKSICQGGGRTSFRGKIAVRECAKNVIARMRCDGLLLDDQSRSDAYPMLVVDEPTANVGHEASVSALEATQVWYAMSRGISVSAARAMIVNGFIDVFVKELPMEYAVEINRLMALDLEELGT